ncbi:MAG: hypothetical protein H7Z21_13150 [Hymenobacter sp.]|nr:hypothetical protein [Hymenobacter sp.]
MLRNPLTWLLLLITATALAACCGSVACNCRDNQDDALFFRFRLDSSAAQGFRTAELDSVFLRRVPIDTAQRPRADTVLLTGSRLNFVRTFTINNAQPFPQSGTRKLDQYDYEIYLGRRRAATTRFVIDTVRVLDQIVGNGCCACNVNTRKELTLNGQYIDLTDPDGQDRPDTVQLGR